MADTRAGTHTEVVRESLISLSRRLESLWCGAAEQLQECPPESVEGQHWGVATERLTDALSSLERYARGLDHSLARRDWASRRPVSG